MTIDDHLLISPCTDQDSRSEKPARGALFTALQRHLSNDHIIIVDSLNYIKGFRYQMYCAAREAKIRVCTVRDLLPPLRIMGRKNVGLPAEREIDLRHHTARAMSRVEQAATRWAVIQL